MGRHHEISNNDDIIDSRDIIKRLDELQDERDSLEADAQDEGPLTDDERAAAVKALADWDEENGEELKALKELAEAGEGYASDWRHGAALIRETYFEDYARQLAEDIGAIDKAASWPNTCIDWKQAAEELQQDYTQIDFDGVAYWVR